MQVYLLMHVYRTAKVHYIHTLSYLLQVKMHGGKSTQFRWLPDIVIQCKFSMQLGIFTQYYSFRTFRM